MKKIKANLIVSASLLIILSPMFCAKAAMTALPSESIERDQCSIKTLFPRALAIPIANYGSSECSAAIMTAIAAERHLKIQHCWRKATVNNVDEVGLVVFKSTGAIGNAGGAMKVASVFFHQSKGRFTFQDFESSGQPDGSAWRVDDGGQLDPDGFDFQEAFRFTNGLVGLVYTWGGGEGVNTYIVVTHHTQLKPICHSYTYSVGR